MRGIHGGMTHLHFSDLHTSIQVPSRLLGQVTVQILLRLALLLMDFWHSGMITVQPPTADQAVSVL